MIRLALRVRQRACFLYLLAGLALLMGGVSHFMGIFADEPNPMHPMVDMALTTWAIWNLGSIWAGFGWTAGDRGTKLTQTLPIGTRDLWCATLLVAWLELMVTILAVLPGGLEWSVEAWKEVPVFLAHYGIAAAFFVLLIQSRAPHLTQVPKGWTTRCFVVIGLAAIIAAIEFNSVLFTSVLILCSAGLACFTWRSLPSAFALPLAEPKAYSGSKWGILGWLSARIPIRPETRVILGMHPRSLLLAMLIYVPLIGFAFPWLGERPVFLWVFGVAMSWPFVIFLKTWIRLGPLPLSPRRYFAQHTLPVFLLFSVGLCLGELVRFWMETPEQSRSLFRSVETPLLLLVLCATYGVMISMTIGKVPQKPLPEDIAKGLRGMPLQIAHLILVLVTLAGGWFIAFKQAYTQALFRELLDGVVTLVPFGAFGAWALMAIGTVSLWYLLERKFGRLDLRARTRLMP
ncbi:MAG: hypothetical protein ACI8X5_000149 [Planctomycetota bacterium]